MGLVGNRYLGLEDNVLLLMMALLLSFVYSIGLFVVKRFDLKKQLPFIPFVLGGYLCLELITCIG